MIETEYMKKKLQDSFLIFEVSDNWYLGPEGIAQLNLSSPQGSLNYTDSKNSGFYRGLDWTYETVQLTANPLAAMQFDNENEHMAISVKKNFPSGHFKEVNLSANIKDTLLE